METIGTEEIETNIQRQQRHAQPARTSRSSVMHSCCRKLGEVVATSGHNSCRAGRISCDLFLLKIYLSICLGDTSTVPCLSLVILFAEGLHVKPTFSKSNHASIHHLKHSLLGPVLPQSALSQGSQTMRSPFKRSI